MFDTSIRDVWTENHWIILCVISKYAQESTAPKMQQQWMRQLALFVILYEGMESNALKLRYSSTLTWITSCNLSERRWLRISQQARSIFDYLWEIGFISGIKLTSIDYQPVTAYRVSCKGQNALIRMPKHLIDQVNHFVYAPSSHNLLQIRYSKGQFILFADKYSKMSNITASMEVSYVSSPYITPCLRSNTSYRIDLSDNRPRALESAHGRSNTIAQNAKNSIILSDIVALVGEWIPFGANQISALKERLGAMERCQGGLFSSQIDEHPTKTYFEVPPGLTQVKILDFDSINSINFEAEINFPQEEGIVQLENFGIHLHVTGELLYGVNVDAIMDHTNEAIPLNLLTLLLVDVHQDSSDIICDLLSQYQISVLKMLYMDDAKQRIKYNMIMARGIHPKLPAHQYLDKGDLENELRQVLGEIFAGYDISSDDVLFLGRNGGLFCGPNANKYESIITTYMGLHSRDIFIRYYFLRTFKLGDTLKVLKEAIEQSHDTNTMTSAKVSLSDAAGAIILLIECLQFLCESLQNLKIPPEPKIQAGKTLYHHLSLEELKDNILIRCTDAIKLNDKLRTELDNLQSRYESVTRGQLVSVSKQIQQNTLRIIQTSHSGCQAQSSLDMIQAILAGNVVLELFDHFVQVHSSLPESKWFVDWFRKRLGIYTVLMYLVLCACSLWWMWRVPGRYFRRKAEMQPSSITVRANVDKRISVTNLYRLLGMKKIEYGRFQYKNSRSELKIFVWTESQFPATPSDTTIELVVDEAHQLLKCIRLQVFCPIEEAKVLNNNDITSQLTKRRPFASFSSRRLHPNPTQSWSMQGLDENVILEKVAHMLRVEGVYLERNPSFTPPSAHPPSI
ncbi:unnamed protein product [Albugo candida]|uniref:Uncharacterized protein n=1 Tax=Albugo candida TaxID=65357 RepID=A0A024GDZ9_9STRA|nr:unnamed protein product [Albugo candida]|eukprot:CCI44978.1 unnamed protein product [Albugo candida]